MKSGEGSSVVTAVLVFTIIALLSLIVVPKLKVGALGSGQETHVIQNEGRMEELEAENVRLREAVKILEVSISKANAEAADARDKGSQNKDTRISNAGPVAAPQSDMNPVHPVDLHHLLGIDSYYGGISYDVLHCGLPYPALFPDMANATYWGLVSQFSNELREGMGKILGRKVGPTANWPDELSPNTPHPQQLDQMVRDPRTLQWIETLSLIMSKFLLLHGRVPLLSCKEGVTAPINDPSLLGKDFCPNLSRAEKLERIGFHAVPYASIKSIVEDGLKYGLCTKPVNLRKSFGNWIKEERMMNDEWHTYNVQSKEQDSVLLMFDMMYEKLGIFKKQYWLGVIAMQNPFDFFSIADVIFTIRPDIIIETGTANGGSALMWSSILHLSNLPESRVITIDQTPPGWDPGQQHWGGIPRVNASASPLWAKHVSFIQGSSVDASTVRKVKNLIPPGSKVMVLLDSAHEEGHVMLELDTYCHLVTPGSYCIVEDTKMSRWSSNGLLPKLKSWVLGGKGPRKFKIDRDRELMYTHHSFGYLQRLP